jgi:hypothetical protein
MRWLQTAVLASAIAWAPAIAAALDAGTANLAGAPARIGRCNLPDLWRFLANVSKDAEVYFPGSEQFNQFSQRWSNVEPPAVNITFLPATENDVVEIVSISYHVGDNSC